MTVHATIDIIHGTGLETAHAIMTSHFHPHLPGTFGANKMASSSVVSSNCLNYTRQCFEGIVSFNQLEQRLYFIIVQKTHPIPPYKFCSSYTKNTNYLTAKILFKIITALIVRYSQVKNCLLLLVIRLRSAEVRLQSLGCYTKISIDSMETPYPPQFPGKQGWHAHYLNYVNGRAWAVSNPVPCIISMMQL